MMYGHKTLAPHQMAKVGQWVLAAQNNMSQLDRVSQESLEDWPHADQEQWGVQLWVRGGLMHVGAHRHAPHDVARTRVAHGHCRVAGEATQPRTSLLPSAFAVRGPRRTLRLRMRRKPPSTAVPMCMPERVVMMVSIAAAFTARLGGIFKLL